MPNLKDNIWKNYLLLFIQGWWFILPIFILYFQIFGISFTQLGSLESIAAALLFILTIPCGAFSDLISRKVSVLLGTLFTGFSMIIIGLSSSYGIFILGYIFWAIGDSFLFNARGAMMYDSVIQIGREEEYLKISGRANIFSVVSLVISGFLGPILFSVNPRLPWCLMGGLWILSSGVIITMEEPEKQKLDYTFKNYIKKIERGVKFTLHEKHVLWGIMFIIAMNVPLSIYNDVFSQAYLLEIGFREESFKFIFPIIYGLASLTASQSHRIEKLLGETGSFLFIVTVHSLGLLLMGLFRVPSIILVVIVLYISRDFRWVFADTYINKYAKSQIRATILSILMMVQEFILSILYIFGGYITDIFGIHPTVLILSGFTICASITLILTKPKSNLNLQLQTTNQNNHSRP
ncbi:MAG: MFS transporter [Candidatus Lokiarchaeota archaeon]|nr:MFS transporter [Candidatus Lokiarchaeota archaeon]